MARDTQTIYNQIDESIKADINLYDPANPDPTKRGLVSTSKVAIWRLWAWIVATSQNILEQLIDQYIVQIETTIDRAPAGTPKWIQDKIFKFQYSATDPQIIQLNTTTFEVYYPTVNETLRIVTQASVSNAPNKTVMIKVAQGGASPTPLDSTQKAALTSYLDFINFSGVYFNLISVDPDLMLVGADVYYNGQYSGVIQQRVEEAIGAFLADSNVNNFNYTIHLTKLQDAIQAVAGVTDVVLRQIEVRPDSVIPADSFKMVDNYTTALRQYNPYAGYMIPDTATGRTLADSINYIISNQ